MHYELCIIKVGDDMDKKRKEIIEGNGVSEIMTVHLGGYDQKILLEGKTAQLPVLIALHGGPGMPVPFGVGCRGLFPEFTEKCILVSWDQYGCGINNAKLSADISINDFVDMVSDLIDILKKKYPDNKLYLLGMSWGSILAAKAAVRKAYALDGVLVYGQVLCKLMQSEEIVLAITESKAPKKIKNDVKSAFETKSYTPEFAMKLSGYIRKYTSGYNNPDEPKAPMGNLMKGYLSSPDYKFGDFMAIVQNGYLKNRSIMKELSSIDLREEMKKITVTYKILQGETDIVTSTSMIKEYVKNSGNSMLSCTVVKNAAHLPGMNGINAILKEIELMANGNF